MVATCCTSVEPNTTRVSVHTVRKGQIIEAFEGKLVMQCLEVGSDYLVMKVRGADTIPVNYSLPVQEAKALKSFSLGNDDSLKISSVDDGKATIKLTSHKKLSPYQF